MNLQKDLLWLKFVHGIGDRLHHIAQAMKRAEKYDVPFVVDMRDGMFGEPGEDIFARYFELHHPQHLAHPDWEQLEQAANRQWHPSNKQYFSASGTWPLNLGGPWLRLPGLNRSSLRQWKYVKWMMKAGLGRFCHWHDLEGQFVAPVGQALPAPSASGGNNWLYFDIVGKTDYHRMARILPHPEIRSEIEQHWQESGLHPECCLGIHIRQTDKSQSHKWRAILAALQHGKYASYTEIFLATDSLRVQDAFQGARLPQILHLSPWTPLEQGEEPLHFSTRFSKKIVLKSALYDMWTLSRCRDFIPTWNSSFSRVAQAWRNPVNSPPTP